MPRRPPTSAADFVAGWSPVPAERARSLPSAMYVDPEVFALERARVFGGPAWVGIGGLHQLREPGAYFTATVAGEPIVALRDADGALRAFSNVCPHRGGPLARGAGKLRGVLQCLYHGWTFGLDGALLRARDFGEEAGFEPAACGLRPVRVETWLQSVFVALDPAVPPLADYLGELRGRIARYALDDYAYAFSKDFELPVNWKVAWETAAESYHLPIVHPQLRFDPRRFREEIGRCYSLQVSLPAEADQARGDGGPLESLVVNLFPNTFLIVPSRVRWDRPYFKATYLLPLGVDSTLYRSDFYVPRERLGDDAWLAPLHAAWDELNRQDREICEALQLGIRSTAYEPGPLSLRWERSLHHFHELLMTRLRGEATAAKEA